MVPSLLLFQALFHRVGLIGGEENDARAYSKQIQNPTYRILVRHCCRNPFSHTRVLGTTRFPAFPFQAHFLRAGWLRNADRVTIVRDLGCFDSAFIVIQESYSPRDILD